MAEAAYIKFIPNEASMLEFGQQLAQAFQCPEISYEEAQQSIGRVIFLYGQLGTGKTTVARGFLQGLGYKDRVKSPTYTLVEPYELLTATVFHFDLYRLRTSQELEFIGIQDYFISGAICLIEWPEQGQGWLPVPDLSCYINWHDQGREIKLIASSAYGKTSLQRLQHVK